LGGIAVVPSYIPAAIGHMLVRVNEEHFDPIVAVVLGVVSSKKVSLGYWRRKVLEDVDAVSTVTRGNIVDKACR